MARVGSNFVDKVLAFLNFMFGLGVLPFHKLGVYHHLFSVRSFKISMDRILFGFKFMVGFTITVEFLLSHEILSLFKFYSRFNLILIMRIAVCIYIIPVYYLP